MFKAWTYMVACLGLAGVIMSQTFQMLDTQSGLNSQDALRRAEQSLLAICAARGLSAGKMILSDEIAPSQAHDAWQFAFRSSTENVSLLLEVDEQGGVQVVSGQSG